MSEGLAPLQVTREAAGLRSPRSCLPGGGGVKAGPLSAPRAPQSASSAEASSRCRSYGPGEGTAAPTDPCRRLRLSQEGDVASSCRFLALCPGRSSPEAGSARPLRGARVQPRPRRVVPFAGARSRPLPLAAPFPFLPLLLRFHSHPTLSCRAPSCSSLSSSLRFSAPLTPGRKEWGDLGLLLPVCSLPGGRSERRLAVALPPESRVGVL